MKAALLTNDAPSGSVLQTLLARAGIETETFRLSRAGQGDAGLETRIAALREIFESVLVTMDKSAPLGARQLAVLPSLEAWLTRDPEANREVLGLEEVPHPEDAARWLRERIVANSNRRFSLSLDGKALAARLDLSILAAFSPSFRSLISTLHPTWANEQPTRRSAGRPPGTALFRGTGYTFCLELLHVGARGEVTATQLIERLHRTKTPIARLIHEAQRRGYLQRSSERGPLKPRNLDQLVDDLVTDAKARQLQAMPAMLSLNADRDPQHLPARLSRRLAEHGRVLALTGATSVSDYGGDLLTGGPQLAYTSLAGIEDLLGDAFVDRLAPRLILIEPREDGMLYRLRPGEPARVSPWQAAIDLLSSVNERERETGEAVKAQLLRETRQG
jgi:hypothetical protein